MKDSCALAAVALLSAVVIGGCAAPTPTVKDSNVQSLVTDYDSTWKAMCVVMSKHFLIKHSDRSEGIVVAAPIRNDGRMGQAETRVSAKIFASESGGYDVEVRAQSYVDISEPRALINKTPRYEWQPTGFDSKLETQLRNEIDDMRFEGRKPAHENKFLESPREEASLPLRK